MRAFVTALIFSLLIVCLFGCASVAYLLYQNDQLAQGYSEQFYRGAYYLCWEANQGYGYVQSEVIKACNEYVDEQRALKVHLKRLEGYQP